MHIRNCTTSIWTRLYKVQITQKPFLHSEIFLFAGHHHYRDRHQTSFFPHIMHPNVPIAKPSNLISTWNWGRCQRLWFCPQILTIWKITMEANPTAISPHKHEPTPLQRTKRTSSSFNRKPTRAAAKSISPMSSLEPSSRWLTSTKTTLKPNTRQSVRFYHSAQLKEALCAKERVNWNRATYISKLIAR